MSDKEEDKKNLNDDNLSSKNDSQSEVDSNNQPIVEKNQNIEATPEESENNLENTAQNENLDTSNEKIEKKTSEIIENIEQTSAETEVSKNLNDNKEENGGSTHQVIHKKDGRLHIYVRQDKYKGELKSKNWVGRLYICLLYTSPSPRDQRGSRMPSSA